MENQQPPARKSTKRIVLSIVAVITILIAVAAAWIIYAPHNRYPSAALKALQTDSNAVIYSLRSDGPPPGDTGDVPGFLRGYEIIGQTTLSSAEDRAILAAELARSTQGAWDGAACFEPRHAFRVSGSSGTLDLLLCYQCGRAQVIHPDGRRKEIFINGTPEVLNQYLTRHNTP